MKRSIIALTACALITGGIPAGCSTSAEKVKTAEENVAEANQVLEKANDAFLAEVENYRVETAEKIAANNQSIADYNARIEYDKKDVKADAKLKIAELEQKNMDLQKRLDDYQIEGKSKWKIFKTEFDSDMNELGAAFKDLTVNNIK